MKTPVAALRFIKRIEPQVNADGMTFLCWSVHFLIRRDFAADQRGDVGGLAGGMEKDS